jgi:hypothetical protein
MIAGVFCENTYSISINVIWPPMVAIGDSNNIPDGFVFACMDDKATAKQKSPEQI